MLCPRCGRHHHDLVIVTSEDGVRLTAQPCCSDCAFRTAEARGDQAVTLDNGVCQRTWRATGVREWRTTV